MMRLQGSLVLVLLLVCAAPAPAQLLFGKKQKPNPTQRVPELILTVKTETDERKRTQAIEELRDYDAAVFTEIVPVLIDVLQQDKKMNVRLEAVNSLAKIRPVTPTAAKALEKAAADDESWRVRWQAKTVLPKYHLAGLTTKKSEPATPAVNKKTTAEPPLAEPPAAPPPTVAPAPRPLPPSVTPLPAPRTEPRTPPTQGPALFPE